MKVKRSTLLLQCNILLKNTGTWDGVITRLRHKLVGADGSHADDAIFKLQYLARLSILYDLADVTAMVTVPSMLSFFVWRDGWYTLAGSGLAFGPCDLPMVWLHFGLLLCIKPVTFYLARKWLEHKLSPLFLLRRRSLD